MLAASVLAGLVTLGATLEYVLGPGFENTTVDQYSPEVNRYLAWQISGGLIGLILYAVQVFRTRRDRVQVLDYLVMALGFSSLMIVPSLLTLVGVLSRLRWREAAIALVLTVVPTALDWALDPSLDDLGENALALVAVLAACVALGLWIGRRREHRESAAERLRNAENKIHTVRAEERARMARDLHDSLSHRLSLMSLHAGALAYRDDLAAAEVTNAASLLQESARQANDDLRSILRVLRDGDEPGADPARPVGEIITEARRAGISVLIDEESETLAAEVSKQPTLIAHTINRTISEGLLNASKHAPGTQVTVQLREVDDDMVVTVTNPVDDREAGEGARTGLIGLRERARAAGGRLEVGVDTHFTLELEVPWTR
ncbi:sensor histidine kinase [Corynebacterium doosanense]|uniref:histidine kinase n=1 Tax=Corynebacterium doosanense CAU 212 = DSM 45436 TaxID=558173 RepID=A0A097IFA2_9CORY|nr:histidine kinase [Corynebacterium doosanense]AIT60817.1 hypothetical protein CDOO_05795 [Corynebacterium doosanense CAU 212 = DSM 45436]